MVSRGQPHYPDVNRYIFHFRPEGHWEPRSQVGFLSPAECLVWGLNPHGCLDHSNLETEAECLMKTLSYLNLNISRTKNGRNKLQEVLEWRRVIEHTDCFHLTQITDKNSQFPLRNWWLSTFTTFLLHLWSSVDADFCISSVYVTSGTKQLFCF